MSVELFRRNNTGKPCIWKAYVNPDDILGKTYIIEHGIVNGKLIKEVHNTTNNRSPINEIKSKTNEKRKKGYKYVTEIKDNNDSPVEEQGLFNYLNTYLPYDRTAADGTLLPMLAKVYDNTNNKLFNKCYSYLGQWKINGLRCFITAEKNEANLFQPYHLKFQSREGVYWNSLVDLEDYLLMVLPTEFIEEMIANDWALDGEVYLPGASVNEINHYVKDPTCKENKYIQFWCYDLAIQDCIQSIRFDILDKYTEQYKRNFDKNTHLSNKERFVRLPHIEITDGSDAISFRDSFIRSGFEGLILRNPNAEYQYGARNMSMIKYKRSTDGKFKIIDIYPEGIKRQNIPLFKLKNDINDAEFEVHVGGNFAYQEYILNHKEQYIGKFMFVEYGERSGVNQVPFHVKETYLIN